MTEFIEKKRLLVFYCITLKFLGWILLCMGGIGFALLTLESFRTGGEVTFEGLLGVFKRAYNHFTNIGLVSLGFAQLVRYLCENDHKMGLLLRYGEKIFYLYAIITVWQEGAQVWFVATGQTGANSSINLHWLMFYAPTLLYKSAEILIYIGLGQFLKRFIAITKKTRLEKSKSQ